MTRPIVVYRERVAMLGPHSISILGNEGIKARVALSLMHDRTTMQRSLELPARHSFIFQLAFRPIGYKPPSQQEVSNVERYKSDSCEIMMLVDYN
jgi:hypothetical protein